MKKQNKNIVKSLTIFAGSIIMLVCGVFWKEWGFEGKAIVSIMCSLYTAMWVHAGIVGDRIYAILEDKKEEIDKGWAIDKSDQ